MRRLPVTRRLLIGTHRTTALLFALCALTACDQPWWYLDNIKITATFRPDGLCSFAVDGETLTDGRYRQENELDQGFGIVAEDLNGYWIRCESFVNQKPILPVLIVLTVVPKGNTPSRGNYDISADEGMSTHVETTVGVLYYEKYSHQGFTNGITGAQLMATEGTFVIDQVMPNRPFLIDGHLSAKARRRALGI